ncbi:DUF3696 domain-containing protein [Achromobacter sp. F4_2707]|uniref:DUF3696 domain-containing protein n=1 Tax=Achromobacter sp. F4_2707 TaxID=3114286 RepID=UPI0039C6F91F
MLTSLRIQNFKAWKDTGQTHFAPLTILFGANSSGKSSLGHLLLAMKQTALSSDRRRPLQLGDDRSLVELGSFQECLHNNDLSQPLHFSFGWRPDHPLTVHDPVTRQHVQGDELQLEVSLTADTHAQPEVRLMSYTLCENKSPRMQLTYELHQNGQASLHSKGYALKQNADHDRPLQSPDKFYRLSDQTRARYENADFATDFALATEAMLHGLHHLGPLRESPRRLYSWSGDAPEDVGQRGEQTIAALLAATQQQRMIAYGPGLPEQRFDACIADWLQRLGIISSFAVRPIAAGRKEYEVMVRPHPQANEVKITDVGFGVSQILPVLVQAFYCQPNTTVWMEQPEVHLHSQVQAELADALIAAVQAHENGQPRGVQIVVESHSEHLLNRIQRRIAEGGIAAEDVAVYFCRRSNSASELEPLRLNAYGEIENWPENFFGDEMADIAARTQAAIAKRRQARATENSGNGQQP